jgi:UDP-N-acetylglucosamine 2-epimerase (non-hydrolysing)
MSQVFFEDLDLPEPDIYLNVGSGTHAEQTGRIMTEFEMALYHEKPDLVIVVGDVNSTLACALTAVKLQIPVAHVEAGLRSFDRTMPEEINRLLTDAISDYLFTPSPDANANLKREGISEDKIYLVGNVMIDSLRSRLEKASNSNILSEIGLNREASFGPKRKNAYALLTLHRPNNVDDRESMHQIFEALKVISQKIPIVFPVHPRTRKKIEHFGLQHYCNWISRTSRKSSNIDRGLHCVDPLRYLDFLKVMNHSKFVMTDSGGIQEETTVLGIPCLTLRDTTERPITLTQGTNVLVQNDAEKIIEEALKILKGKPKKINCPELWDGKAAERIVDILVAHQEGR